MVTPPDKDRPSYRFLIAWGLIASLLVAALYLYAPLLLADLDRRAYDVLLRSAHRVQTSGRVVIVSLDEKTLARFGRWPWPRSRLAQLAEKIAALGAASVGIDMIFAEPDESPLPLTERRSTELAQEPEAGPGALTPNDAALAAVLGRGAFILGYEMRFNSDREGSRDCVLHPIPAVSLQERGAGEKSGLFESSGTLCSLPGLAKAASGSGFLNVTIDADGILRRIPLVIARDGLVYPSLGLATLIPALGIRQFILRTTRGGTESLALDDTVVPLDPRGGLLLHFRGEKQTFPYVSAADVLEDRLAEGEFRDRIVFLGTSAPGLGDSVATPLDTRFPGVEVHATVADTILRGDFIRRLPGARAIDVALVLAAGLAAAFIVAVAGITWGSLMSVAAAGGIWLATGWLMRSTGLFISPLFPAFALVFSFTAVTVASFFFERGRAARTTQHLRRTQQTMLEELRKSQAELRAEQQRAIEAKRALEIHEQEAILGRVAASVAHEINNPLQAIKTRLHTLKKIVADRPGTTEKIDLVMGQLDRIGRATRSMLGVFKQRTAYSKLVSYVEVIHAAVELFEPSFEAKGVRVAMNLPNSLPGVTVSVDELQEVLINLLENERDALGRDNDLYVSAQARDHRIVIRIEDNGPGLGPDPERLFEAFYTTKSTGTGLGLTIARRICESYGGALTATNREEGGACFEIILPLAAKHEER